ncbi:MAG: Tol-Pal system beta propeller repeat protein TolB [Desulfobacterales bacterium]
MRFTISFQRTLKAGIIVGLALCMARISPAADYQIDITNPFINKIPLAVPLFKPMAGGENESRLAQEGADILSDGLEFTGYFKLLNRAGFLIDPQTYSIVSPGINFQNWTTVGAELLVTGGILLQGETLTMELRLYDTVKEQLLVGKRYTGSVREQRGMLHRFCDEVIFELTGSHGIFGSQIVFVTTSKAGVKDIYRADFDGHNPQVLVTNNQLNLSPSWSSDGKWIAYTSYAKGKPDLYIKHISEKRGYQVLKKGTSISPAWVPNRLELAASLSYTGDPEIYLLTGTGKVIRRLTESRGIDVSPSWSPDGRRFAFVSKRSGTPQIYLQESSSGSARRLTYEGKNNTQPSWSPRGDKIAYTAIEDGQINIRVIGIDGNGVRQLTINSGDNESPSWSPDGSLLIFSSTREGPSRIYVMNAFGTDQRRLLTLPGKQSEPKWSMRLENF